MSGRDLAFVDTNVLVYAYSAQDFAKSAAAQTLIKSLAIQGQITTSTQVLQELYSALTKNTKWRVEPEEALRFLAPWQHWNIVTIDPAMVLQAARLSINSIISFWDAMIVVSANRAGATRLYTEDLSHGQKIMGLEILNPFLACA